MIIILKPDVPADGPEVEMLLEQAARFPNISTKVYAHHGEQHALVEIHLVGETKSVPTEPFAEQPFVMRVVRISEKFRLIGRHGGQVDPLGFDYRGLRFSQNAFHVFPGLCAVDNRENVDKTYAAISAAGIRTARMGAYKPRTSPYEFQGHGKKCLPYVFELAAKYGIQVTAMEITHESHLDEIREALEKVGNATGVMLQIGTRNAQNFELLKIAGQQKEFPVLYKRGMGNTIEEAINACEYIASEGNTNVIFCLRGVKTHLSAPQRNLVDFPQVPVIKTLTRLPVCVDPSHSTGRRTAGMDGLPEIHHATAQGIVAGANMVLVDFHPDPPRAMCDGPQALTLEELPGFLEDVQIVREAYQKRVAAARARPAPPLPRSSVRPAT